WRLPRALPHLRRRTPAVRPTPLQGSGRGLVDVDFDPEVAPHDLLQSFARRIQHLQPTIVPVANAGQPGRAAPAGPRLPSVSGQTLQTIATEQLPPPDLLD